MGRLPLPVTTLQRPKKQGGWELIDIAAKCRASLLSRVWLQSKRLGTITAAWLKECNVMGTQANSPLATRILNKLAFLKYRATEINLVLSDTRNHSHE